jgi:hypothetical protein
MSTRSERARRRAARVRNQRIAILVIALLILAGAAVLVYDLLKQTNRNNLSAASLPKLQT